MRATTLTVILGAMVLLCSSPALAAEWPLRDFRQATGAQYNTTTNNTTTNNTTTTPGTSTDTTGDDTAGDDTAGDDSSGSDDGGPVPSAPATGGGTGTGTGAGAGTGTAGTGVAATTSVAIISFGDPGDIGDDITAAIAQAGLTQGPSAALTKESVEAFLASDAGKALATGGAEAIGAAVAELLLAPTDSSAAALGDLFGTAPTEAITHGVFTQAAEAEGDYAAFIKGLVEGLSSIPTAYVEGSDADPSFVDDFEELDVPTVDNIDEAAGKAALVAILVDGAETASGETRSAEIGPSPFREDEGTLGGATPFVLLLALALAAGAWVGVGMRTSRRLRRTGS